MNKVKDFFKEAYDVLKKPEVRILPGNLAFFMVFSIIPIFTLIIFIASSFSLEMIVSTLDSVIPEAVISAVTNFIHSDAFSFANSVTLIISFLLISNGANSLIITTNTLYGIEPNSILKFEDLIVKVQMGEFGTKLLTVDELKNNSNILFKKSPLAKTNDGFVMSINGWVNEFLEFTYTESGVTKSYYIAINVSNTGVVFILFE